MTVCVRSRLGSGTAGRCFAGQYRQPVTDRRTETVLLVVNGVGVVAAAAFSAVGVHRPGYVSHAEPVTPLATFWTTSSAVRTWALAGPLLIALRRSDSGSRSALLVVAGLTQLGDAVLGVRRRDPAMSTAPAVMGVVHLLSARALRTQSG